MSDGTQGGEPLSTLAFRRSSRALGRPALPADGDALHVCSVRSDLGDSVSSVVQPVGVMTA